MGACNPKRIWNGICTCSHFIGSKAPINAKLCLVNSALKPKTVPKKQPVPKETHAVICASCFSRIHCTPLLNTTKRFPPEIPSPHLCHLAMMIKDLVRCQRPRVICHLLPFRRSLPLPLAPLPSIQLSNPQAAMRQTRVGQPGPDSRPRKHGYTPMPMMEISHTSTGFRCLQKGGSRTQALSHYSQNTFESKRGDAATAIKLNHIHHMSITSH